MDDDTKARLWDEAMRQAAELMSLDTAPVVHLSADPHRLYVTHEVYQERLLQAVRFAGYCNAMKGLVDTALGELTSKARRDALRDALKALNTIVVETEPDLAILKFAVRVVKELLEASP